MAYRTFADDTGRSWEAWDVIPRGIMLAAPERRMTTDRRQGDPATVPPEEDRRTGLRRVAVSPGMERGWLAFRSGRDRRRISPIPDGWADWTDERLRHECAHAHIIQDADTQR